VPWWHFSKATASCWNNLDKKGIFEDMKSLEHIKSILSQQKDRLFTEYPIKSMAIFGSYARGEPSDDSDVDILVEFDDKIGIRFIDLAEEIEELLGDKVDLVSRKGIKEKYYQVIQQDLIYV
jgi:predicted nucleotidyltransferase